MSRLGRYLRGAPARPNPGDLIANRREVRAYGDDVDEIAGRAVGAGAAPPLRWLGTGASAMVFEDARGVGWKVARVADALSRARLGEEAAWLAAAARAPAVAPHVAAFRAWHPEAAAIEREAVRARPDRGGGGWKGNRLYALHERVVGRMRALGWGAPEFKEDSWVRTADRGPVLVDAGPALRMGWNHARTITDVLAGRRPRTETWRTLAWEVRSEVSYGRLPAAAAAPLLARLAPLVEAEERAEAAALAAARASRPAT